MLAIGIIIEAAISFVELGVQPPTPNWGNMLSSAREYLLSGEWWLSVFPGAEISLTIVGFNLLGDGLRDRLHPRHNPPEKTTGELRPLAPTSRSCAWTDCRATAVSRPRRRKAMHRYAPAKPDPCSISTGITILNVTLLCQSSRRSSHSGQLQYWWQCHWHCSCS